MATYAPEPNSSETSHKLARWTKRYAQSRAWPGMIGMVVYFPLFMALFFLWSLTGDAYRSGSVAALALCVAALATANLVVIWLSVPRWGGKWLQRVVWSTSKHEGAASPHTLTSQKRIRRIATALTLVFALCVPAHVALGFLGYAPEEYAQPISALYFVPWMLFVGVAARSYALMLWAILYAVHGLLVVLGAPVQLTEEIGPFNTLVPCVGYGLLAGLVVHAYNRAALAKVKRLAWAGLSNETRADSQGEDR